MLERMTLRKRLVEDLDCRESQVDGVVTRVEALAPDIAAAFEEWFRTGAIKEVEVEGYTVAALRAKKKNLNVVGAYLTLDWLRREPEKAKRALERMEMEGSAVRKFAGRG